MDDIKFPTPSQFYRNLRPENFSDSKITSKTIIPRELLDYEISQISTNQKHDNFETFCRKLAEKLISPNLIPQVGPTGGGDGKTDSETYPVSNFISERWYVSNNKWNENENWAFAISAKSDWKPKVKSDVRKIVETKRGYTQIFFFTNQKISSKNKKEIQDQIRDDLKIELTILDSEWILEKVYSNQLLNLAIESLNLSRIYLEEKIVGPRDTERLNKLGKLEEQINSNNRYFEVDFQLVENCLESAIVSRMLELPRAEVIGKFERAQKFAYKLGNNQLKIRVHYQLAWTLINWYDDYKLFYSEFLIVKELVNNNTNIINIEFYLNLSNILHSIKNVEEVKNFIEIDYEKESEEFTKFLIQCSQNTDKPSSSLLAKFYLSIFQLKKILKNEILLSTELKNLRSYFELSRNHIDIPFEQLKEMINIFGDILPSNIDYDNLIDSIAEIESSRDSELTSGQTYLNRGVTKLKNNLNKESLVYFGKASRKLAKDETQSEFYYCLMLLSNAYSKLDLYWASYNALITATNIFANVWFTTGSLNIKFLKGVEEILMNELKIGRVPVLFCWHELYSVLQRYFQQEDTNKNLEHIPAEHMTDISLSIRLLNLEFKDFENLKFLPDILKANEFWLSEDAALYLTGNENLIQLNDSKTSLSKENLPEYYNKLANQPFVKQIAYETNFLNKDNNFIESQVLGILVKISFPHDLKLLILAENILAYLESFLATSFEEVFPVSENLNIYINYGKIDGYFKLDILKNDFIKITLDNSTIYNGKTFNQLIESILPQIIGGNYLIKDSNKFFENLFKKDEVNERLSIIVEHYNFLTNILTKNPKFFLQDWINSQISEYDILRKESPIILDKNLIKVVNNGENEERPNYQNITHKKFKAETIINNELWDKAKWVGFGFFSTPQIPFGMMLSFENIEFGEMIFKEWIKKYGKIDKNDSISITIIKGIDKNNPAWYKVLISKRINKGNFSGSQLISLSLRFHRMEPSNSTNLDNLIHGFELHNKYVLIPAQMDKNLNITPIVELGIFKTELKIINAWEIGVNDLERVVITETDNPIIPENITNAPITEILNERDSYK